MATTTKTEMLKTLADTLEIIDGPDAEVCCDGGGSVEECRANVQWMIDTLSAADESALTLKNGPALALIKTPAGKRFAEEWGYAQPIRECAARQ